MNTPPTRNRSNFEQVSTDVLTGHLPLFGALSRRQLKRGKTDCAIPMVSPDYPGCLAIGVLREGGVRVVASFQPEVKGIWPVDAPSLPIQATLEYAEDFVQRCTAQLSKGENHNIDVLIDVPTARAVVMAFTEVGGHGQH